MFGWKADGFTSTTLHRDYAPVGRVYRSGKGWTADVDGIPDSPTFPILAEAQRWVEDRCPLPLCPACIGSIGGAHGGPDAPYRQAKPGEPCGAADCQGAPDDDDDEPDAYEVWNATGSFPK